MPRDPDTNRPPRVRSTRRWARRCRCGRKPEPRCVAEYQSRSNQPIVVTSRPGSSAADGATSGSIFRSSGKRVARAGIQLNLDRADIRQGLSRRRQGGAEPPFDVGGGGGPECMQPPARQLVRRRRPAPCAAPSQSVVRTHRGCDVVQLPSLGPRTISPRAESTVSTRGATGIVPPQGFPGAGSYIPAISGSAERSSVLLTPARAGPNGPARPNRLSPTTVRRRLRPPPCVGRRQVGDVRWRQPGRWPRTE